MYPGGRPSEVRPSDSRGDRPRHPLMDARRLLLHDANSAKEIDMTHARIRAFDETVKYFEQMKFGTPPAAERTKLEKSSSSRASTPDSDSDLYVQPLDLSFQAKKQARDADSPLDLSVKTTRRIADTTGASDLHEPGLVKRHDLLSPRPGGVCDTTNAPRNPKKEKLLQYERVSQQNQQKAPLPQPLTPQQHRQQMQMHYLKQQQQQQQRQLASVAREPPKTKESVAVDSTLQILRQQKLMQAYQSAFLKGHLPYSAPASPMPTQPMTQGLPHPHVNRVPRPPSKGMYQGREGEIRGPSPAMSMSPSPRATPGKESPKSLSKASPRPGPETPRAGTPQIPPKTSPQMHSPIPSLVHPTNLEQMRLIQHAMARRYMLGSDGKPHPGYHPMPPQDFRMPNGAIRLPNGMLQHGQTPPPRKREAGKSATATPLRIEIPDSSHSSPLLDKVSPSPAMQARPSPSYYHNKPRMGLGTPRFSSPKVHNKPNESGSPPPLSMADAKTPVAVPPPPIRGSSPLPSPQMPVLSPHTKSPTLMTSPRNSPTIKNSGSSERDKGVDLESKETVSQIMNQVLPQFARKYRNIPDEEDSSSPIVVKETILNVPRPLRSEHTCSTAARPYLDNNSARQVPRSYEGKSVNSILENAIKREIQQYDKDLTFATPKKSLGNEKGASGDGENQIGMESNSYSVDKECIENVNKDVKSEAETVVNDQDKSSTVAHEVKKEHQESSDQIELKCESPSQKRDEQNATPVSVNDLCESADSPGSLKVRPPCGRVVQKTSPSPKVRLGKAGAEISHNVSEQTAVDSKNGQAEIGPKSEMNDLPGLSQGQASNRKSETGCVAGSSVPVASQRPPPMRNVWSTIRIENGEISPMPMPAPLVEPLRKGTCAAKKSESPKPGRSTDSPKERVESKARPEPAGCSDVAPKGQKDSVKKTASTKRPGVKKMAPLMKKTVMMRHKLQQGSRAARMKIEEELLEARPAKGPTGSKQSTKKRSKKQTAVELRRERRRSILDEIANSQGFVGDAKKRKQAADDLYADPALLDREERALRCAMSKSKRAMLQFSEMDGEDMGSFDDDEDDDDDDDDDDEEEEEEEEEPPDELEPIKVQVPEKVGTRKRRSGEKLLDPSDLKKRKIAKGHFERGKKGAGEVLETRTRTQAAATKTGPPLTTYNKNAAYERELKREETKAKILKAKRTKGFGKEKKLGDVNHETENPDTGNDVPEADIEKETEDDDTRKMFRNKSRSAALRLLWQRRRIEQAKQWSYNSLVKAGGKRKRRSRTKRIKFCRSRKSRSARLALEVAALQQHMGDDTYDFHDDDACVEMPDTRPVPPEMKRMVVNKNSGETILHRAARLGYEDVVIYCLETGTAEVNARDNAGYTSLHECCVRGHLNIAKYLINYGANVNCSATDGTRPIHDAVDNDHLEVARLLLSHGSDPLLATYSGRTPMKAARYPKMRAFLKGFLADLNGPSEEEMEQQSPWEFGGSTYYSDPTSTGFSIFSELPSDPEDGDLDLEFEFSSEPHIRTYRLELENENGPKNYVLMTDVLDRLKLSRQEFMERHPKICVGTKRIRSAIFRHQVESSCFDDVTGSPSSASRRQAQFTELLRLDNDVRELLDIPVIRVDYHTERIQVPLRVNDPDEDMESIMSDDTVIYADDLGNEADTEEEKPSADEPVPSTSRDSANLHNDAVSAAASPDVIEERMDVEEDMCENQVKSETEGSDVIEIVNSPPESVKEPQPEQAGVSQSQEQLTSSNMYIQRDQMPRHASDYYRQLAYALPEPYPERNRVTSAAATTTTAAARGVIPHASHHADARRTLDLNSAIHRSITQAMSTQPPSELGVSREQAVAATREQIVAVSREQMSKSAMNYHNIPYMYKTPHHSHMRGNMPGVHQYPLPHPASQQYSLGRQHPHQPPTTRTDYYAQQYRHSLPQNCHSLYQMQQQRGQRDHQQHMGASHSKEMESHAEAKRTTDAIESPPYLLKVATTPEEYFMNYKQRLNTNSSPQYHQRNPGSLMNGVSTPPHPHVPAHVQTRPERLPPYL